MTSLGWPDLLRFKKVPKRFCLELFAGTARITTSLLKRGMLAFPIDICIDSGHNVFDIHLQHKLLHWVQGGYVQFIWLGIPCTSFTRARKDDGLGPGPLRSDEFVSGLPWLSPNDLRKVREGNELLRISLRLLHACELARVPYALENPASSFIWDMPGMKTFLSKFSVTQVFLDYCQYGEPWKKPTSVIGNFWDLRPLQRRCTTVNRVCSRTQRPHTPLSGRDSSGCFWTLRAQPYPRSFCEVVASQAAIALQL